LSTAAGPKGGATAILPKEVIVDTVLDMDPEEVLEDDAPPGDNAPAMPAQNSEVQAAFDDFTNVDVSASLTGDNDLFDDNPIIPDGTTTITVPLLKQWAAWVAAGRPEVEALRQWNPALHPRNPETGQFVERSFDVPESDIDVIQSGDPAKLLGFISDTGSRSDIEAVLQDDAVTVDGIPDDINTNRDLKNYISDTDPEDRIPPSARVDDSGTAEMFDEEFVGEESVSLLDAGGAASDRRRPTDVRQRGPEIPGELIKSKQVPEGEDILVDEGDRVVPRTVRGYSRPGDTEHPVLDTGVQKTDPDEVEAIYRAAPRAEAELSFDEWPDRYAERKRVVERAVRSVVPRGQNDVSDRTIKEGGETKTPEIDDATFDRATDRIASVLGDTDRETAETVISRLQSIGDNLDRAHAGDRPGENRPRSYMDISENESQSTIKHELGHVMASSLGFGAVDASQSHEMNFYPAEDDDIDLSDEGEPISGGSITTADDPVEQLTVGYSNGPVADARGVEDTDERTSVGRSEWEDEVREEIPEQTPDLGPRNFRNATDEYLLEANEGDMIRADGPQEFGRHLSITEVDDDPTGVAEREFVAVAEDGTEYEFTVEDRFGDVFIDSKSITDDPTRESVIFRTAGKRQSTPDTWGESEPDTPEPDDVLGGDAADTSEGRMREFVSAANRAWFRANLMANRNERSEATRFNIKSGYSTTSAHETIAQTVEMMHAGRDKQRDVNTTAARLVRNNPELIEAYRHIADIPDPMRSAINEELDINGAEFRLGETDE
jgi:hypothetical protein